MCWILFVSQYKYVIFIVEMLDGSYLQLKQSILCWINIHSNYSIIVQCSKNNIVQELV